MRIPLVVSAPTRIRSAFSFATPTGLETYPSIIDARLSYTSLYIIKLMVSMSLWWGDGGRSWWKGWMGLVLDILPMFDGYS